MRNHRLVRLILEKTFLQRHLVFKSKLTFSIKAFAAQIHFYQGKVEIPERSTERGGGYLTAIS